MQHSDVPETTSIQCVCRYIDIWIAKRPPPPLIADSNLAHLLSHSSSEVKPVLFMAAGDSRLMSSAAHHRPHSLVKTSGLLQSTVVNNALTGHCVPASVTYMHDSKFNC